MEENPELEEGEAFQCMDDGNNSNMDPDIALSYIDEKIQNVLGHFQKDFEGGVSAENLGAKFGGYGSFLPTYERSPQRSSVPSHPKTPQRNCSSQRSPNNLPMEGASLRAKVPLNDAPSVKFGISSGNFNALRKPGLAFGNVPVKKESKFSKNPQKSGHFSDQRTLKVRIKVGPDSVARKNAAIYSGLGLDNSPSSSLGKSPEVSGEMPLQQTADESPTIILQVMTSFPVPGGAIISPLHDNLLCLIKKETFCRDGKPDPFLKGGQTNYTSLEKESVSLAGNEKLSKGKGVKFPSKVRKAVEVKHENDIVSGNGTAFLTGMKLEIEELESKKFVSNNLKSIHLSGSKNGNGAPQVGGKPSEVPWEADVDGVGGRNFSSDLMKEDSLESRSGQDSSKSGKRKAQTQNGAVEKVPEPWEVLHVNDDSVHVKGNKKSKKSKNLALSKAYFDASGNKEDLPRGSPALSKQKIVQQDAFCVPDEFSMPSVKKKPLSESKKLHGSKSSKKAVSHGSLEIGVNRESKDLMVSAHSVFKSKDKMQKLKFQDGDVKDLTTLEQQSSQMRFLELSSGNGQKVSIIDVHNASLDNLKEGISGKEVVNQLIHSSFKDVANAGISLAGNSLASEVAPPVPTVVIEEHWVCCDSCQKWRLLPHGTLPDQLPENWLCSMLNWLPGMNRCDISEEETTKALHALYHVPLAVGQNNLQIDTSRPTSGVNVQHANLSHRTPKSLFGPTQGKKKHGLKEIAKEGISSGKVRSSNSLNNQFQESVKCRNVNNMIQPPAEANLMNKSSLCAASKSRNIVAEVKQSPVTGGNTKQVKMKNKREADHYGYGNPKKPKTDVSDGDKHYNSDKGSGRLGVTSKNGLSIKVRGKDMLKSNECSFSGDVKCDTKERFPVSLKKLSEQSQMSSDGGCLNVRTSDKMNISMKKRKLKEWQDDQNGLNRTNAEGSSEIGLKKLKKLKVSKSGASVMNNTSDNLGKKEKMGHILSSGSQDHTVDGEYAERLTYKDQRPRKHRRSFTSQKHLDGKDTSRKDLGLGQLSTTATSSSSKVSGSLKTRTALDDVKGSPVESVSSSPMRVPFSGKLRSFRGDILGKDDAKDGGLPVTDELMTGCDGKGDDRANQCGTGKEKKVSSGRLHPEAITYLSVGYQDGDAKHKVSPIKCSSLLLNGADEFMERHKSSFDPFATKNLRDEVRVEKNLNENMLPLHKPIKGPSLQSKENGRSSVSNFDRDPKLFTPGNSQVDILIKKTGKESGVDPGSHTSLLKRMNNVSHSIPDKASNKFGKDEKLHVCRSNSVNQFSKDVKMDIPLKQEPNNPNKKLVSLESRKQSAGPKGNLPDPDNEIKIDSVLRDLKIENSALVPHAEWEAKHENHIQQSAQGFQREGAPDGSCALASGTVDMSKASRRPRSCEKMNGVQCMIDARSVKDLTAPIPASSQTTTNTLHEAKTLKDYADQLKNSGFDFESNETNFKSALKFLHGASLLETSNEVGRQGEMTQMQAYRMTAKLCECCAVEYERRCEMASAALAYKCMEVAHWRIVFCKNSSLNRDRNELQACLQTFPQGESPSSSASDIDNLNNQTTVDKATVTKSSISHVAGNPVVARNHSNFLRLLDFTQDVNFALEASSKSQNAYLAANAALEAQNKDCIISIKKVIDFSFQDVEELLHLVQHALDAINRAGPIDKRD